jgi:protein SCO1/2
MTSATLRLIRTAAWVAVLIVGGAALWFAAFADRGDIRGTAVMPSLGGPFELIDQTGATVTEAALQGHASALFFGYTYCPDVCPTTLFEATNWLRELGSDADRLKVYFITVDPARDTRESLAMYLQAFDPRIVGLTGSQAQVDQIVKAYGVTVEKAADAGNYLVNHTASVFLLDSEARFVGTIAYGEDPETALAKLRRLVGAA